MSNENAFTKGLFAAYDKLQLLEERLTTTMSLNDSDKIEAAYYKSLQVHESAEELALITRNLPVLTGRLDAETEIRKTVKKMRKRKKPWMIPPLTENIQRSPMRMEAKNGYSSVLILQKTPMILPIW